MGNDNFLEKIQVAFIKHAESTRKSYNDEMRFFSAFTKKALAETKDKDATAYLYSLNSAVSCHDHKPLAAKTIKRKILTLYSIFEDAITLDLVSSNPFYKAARIARDIKITYKRTPKHVPFKDVSAIVAKCNNLRDRAIFAILFGGGLRVSELVRLKTCDLKDFTDSYGLEVVTAKTNKLRPVLLPYWTKKILDQYLKNHESVWLFPNRRKGGTHHLTRKWVSNLCYKKFGLRAHAARHTHISYLLSIKTPIVEVARSVGHESITSTMIYDRRILDFNSSSCKDADFFQSSKKVLASS